MGRARGTLLLALLAWAAVPAAATAAEPIRQTLTVISRQQADDREHPRAHLVPVVVPRPFHGGARVCGYYENDTYHLEQDGRVKLEVSVWRAGERIARVGFPRRKVRANQLDLGCRSLPRLRRGDTVLFDFRFSEMPRLSPRAFSRGGVVHTYMLVRASVEPPPRGEPSTIELLAVEPALDSRVPGGGRIRVRVAYDCRQPMGCNVAAGFRDNGGQSVVRGVRPGSRDRTLVLRCPESRGDLVMRGLTVEIQRQEDQALASATVPGEITCVGSGYD